jgi:hypothetical protein
MERRPHVQNFPCIKPQQARPRGSLDWRLVPSTQSFGNPVERAKRQATIAVRYAVTSELRAQMIQCEQDSFCDQSSQAQSFAPHDYDSAFWQSILLGAGLALVFMFICYVAGRFALYGVDCAVASIPFIVRALRAAGVWFTR